MTEEDTAEREVEVEAGSLPGAQENPEERSADPPLPRPQLVFGGETRVMPGVDRTGKGPDLSTSCGACKGRSAETLRPLRLQCSDCEEVLHGLANVITAVVLNAQSVGWKLPPYSHLKRPLREIERNAQRASGLLQQLTQRLGDAGRS